MQIFAPFIYERGVIHMEGPSLLHIQWADSARSRAFSVGGAWLSMIICGLLVSTSSVANAQLVTDGSVGSATSLTGPNYQIPTNLGKMNSNGTTLLHSFRQFDLLNGQSATFTTTSASLRSLIVRVTGGMTSSIDGTVISMAPNADLYFMNPRGVIFGSNAYINVPAGFHVSTAEQLILSDGSYIPISASPVGTLSAAPVQSCGFLGGGLGVITVADGLNIGVGGGADFTASSLNIVGDISLNNPNRPSLRLGAVGASTVTVPIRGAFNAIDGNINIGDGVTPSNVGSTGDIFISSKYIEIENPNLFLTGVSSYGNRNQTGPSAAGGIFINADGLKLINSSIASIVDSGGSTFSQGPINIQLTGALYLNGGTIVQGGGLFNKGADLLIKASNITLDNYSSIFNGSVQNDALDGGKISIQATGNMAIDNGSEIAANAASNSIGNAGTIIMNIDGKLSVTNGSSIDVSSAVPFGSPATNKAGQININAGSLHSDGSIFNYASSTPGQSSGSLNVSVLGDIGVTNTTMDGAATSGQGGSLTLSAGGNLALLGGSEANGPGGTVALTAGGTLTFNSSLTSPSGNIALTGSKIDLVDDRLSGSLLSIDSPIGGGSILLKAPSISVGADSGISTASLSKIISGPGGAILIGGTNVEVGGHSLILSDASTTGSVFNDFANGVPNVFTTSTHSASSSGIIGIYGNKLVIESGAQISSTAPEGIAGTIALGATDFVLNGGVISSNSAKGGMIEVGGDRSITVNGGALLARVTGGVALDGPVILGYTLDDPLLTNSACVGSCLSLSPFSTSWTPGTHYGIPPREDAGRQPLSIGVTQPNGSPSLEGDGAPGFHFDIARSSEPASSCVTEAAQALGRNSFAEMLAQLPRWLPGVLRPESYLGRSEGNQRRAWQTSCNEIQLVPTSLRARFLIPARSSSATLGSWR